MTPFQPTAPSEWQNQPCHAGRRKRRNTSGMASQAPHHGYDLRLRKPMNLYKAAIKSLQTTRRRRRVVGHSGVASALRRRAASMSLRIEKENGEGGRERKKKDEALVKAIKEKLEDAATSVVSFDQIAAYELLVEMKYANQEEYRETNHAYSEAHDSLQKAKSSHAASRKKPMVRRRKERSVREAPASIREKQLFAENYGMAGGNTEWDFDVDADAPDAYGAEAVGTDWGLDQSGDGEVDRGEEIGRGDTKGGKPSYQQSSSMQAYAEDAEALGKVMEYDPMTHASHRMPTNDDEYELVIDSGASTPNSLFDEDVAEAKEAQKQAYQHSNGLWEEMRGLKTEQNRFERHIQNLQKQFPELRGYVDLAGKERKKWERQRREEEDMEGEAKKKKDAFSSRKFPPQKQGDVGQWLAKAREVLQDHAALKAFPLPPAWKCEQYEAVCHHRYADASERLRACEHNIAAIFELMPVKKLKGFMTLFHPDRFAICAVDDEEKALWQAWEGEMFVVVAGIVDSKKKSW